MINRIGCGLRRRKHKRDSLPAAIVCIYLSHRESITREALTLVRSLRERKPATYQRLMQLPHTTVASPLNLFHLARDYIHLERTTPANPTFSFFHGNRVVTGWYKNLEVSLIVSRKRSDRVISFLHVESNVGKRSRIWNANYGRATANRTDTYHSFESGRGFCLCHGKAGKQK